MRRALLNSARETRAVPHPRDRAVRQLEKREKRIVRLDEQKTRLKTEQALRLMRFFWFREQCLALGYTSSAVPEDTVALLAQLYVDRNKEELAALRAQRNPPAGRIKVLEATLQAELDELHSTKGLRLPSLADADDVEILTEIWDGAPETATVVPVAGFSMQRRAPPAPDALARLSQRLRPVAEVRDEAPGTRPRRVVKFHAARKKKVSAKKTQDTVVDAKSRVQAREGARQQKRLAEQRRAALAHRRHRPPTE
ncbi:hypothetical protein NESM_000298100 [Novymonas esmeraldas]|uniref:Uncharacterized protein n=1 Tax=Novymonas esmeraldas TaxID=1808958 RepID=A0AAW0FAY8_9TRYP